MLSIKGDVRQNVQAVSVLMLKDEAIQEIKLFNCYLIWSNSVNLCSFSMYVNEQLGYSEKHLLLSFIEEITSYRVWIKQCA